MSSIGRKSIIITVIVLIVSWAIFSSFFKANDEGESRIISKNEILHLEINGVIMNGKKFLQALKKYSKKDSVKAIVIEINSPGGAVGPSQEIYYEIIRTKKETRKPIICVSTGLIASGGYYSALACDKLIVAPGTMIGSIGVIMEFANLEDLYGWAKVKRFSITSGKFKDSGSEYRAMRDDEKQLFQDMIDEVYNQFRDAVAQSRNLPLDVVSAYADGRVMTGAKAVELKFADSIGTYEDAVRMAAQISKLGKDYHILKPKKEHSNFFEKFLVDEEDDDLNASAINKSLLSSTSQISVESALKKVFKTQLLNQPLYMMPGYWD